MKKSAKSFLSLAFCMSMLVTSGMSLQASADEMCIATNSHYQTVEDITMKPINPSNSENDVYKIAV